MTASTRRSSGLLPGVLGYLTLGLFDLPDHALARGGELVSCASVAPGASSVAARTRDAAHERSKRVNIAPIGREFTPAGRPRPAREKTLAMAGRTVAMRLISGAGRQAGPRRLTAPAAPPAAVVEHVVEGHRDDFVHALGAFLLVGQKRAGFLLARVVDAVVVVVAVRSHRDDRHADLGGESQRLLERLVLELPHLDHQLAVVGARRGRGDETDLAHGRGDALVHRRGKVVVDRDLREAAVGVTDVAERLPHAGVADLNPDDFSLPNAGWGDLHRRVQLDVLRAQAAALQEQDGQSQYQGHEAERNVHEGFSFVGRWNDRQGTRCTADSCKRTLACGKEHRDVIAAPTPLGPSADQAEWSKKYIPARQEVKPRNAAARCGVTEHSLGDDESAACDGPGSRPAQPTPTAVGLRVHLTCVSATI